jgi:hypothetical protein
MQGACAMTAIKLFDNALMTINLLGLLEVWGQLVEAYWRKGNYGGDTVEIYAYHLTRYRPLAHGKSVDESVKAEAALHAANALCSILEEFCDKYGCNAEIDGMNWAKWCALCNHGRHTFDHRCHIKIIRRQEDV